MGCYEGNEQHVGRSGCGDFWNFFGRQHRHRFVWILGVRIARYPFYNFTGAEIGTIWMLLTLTPSTYNLGKCCVRGIQVTLLSRSEPKSENHDCSMVNDRKYVISNKHKGTADCALQAPPPPPQSYLQPCGRPVQQASAYSDGGTTPTSPRISQQTSPP